MTPGRLSAESVQRATEEFDRLGRDAFLRKYGFGRATEYALHVNERQYDPKAIAGVAYGFDHPSEGTLSHKVFNGGRELERAFPPGFQLLKIPDSSGQTIVAHIRRILEEYASVRLQVFGGGGALPDVFRNLAQLLSHTDPVATRPTVAVKPSFGQGNWARVPWVAFLDSRETRTTQRGVYPVLLFREDMSGVYLTIAQGVTEPAARGRDELIAHLRRVSDAVKAELPRSLTLRGFSTTNDVDLRARGTLARNYELSVIAYKLYEKQDLPSDDDLVMDLEAVMETVDKYLDRRVATRSPAPVASLRDAAQAFRSAVDESGLQVATGYGDRVASLVAALVTKPFVILTGLSGSGKTQLGLRLGEWFGVGPAGQRFEVIAVRPDWTSPDSLFGYEDGLRPTLGGRAAWFVPPTLKLILKAASEPDFPYLLLLDEMNLAHVERYFSDFLSGLESRESVVPNLKAGDDGAWRLSEDEPERLPIPRNLFVIGTVNVDETTYQFSPKVLDRAMTFEVRTLTTELDTELQRPRPVASGDEPLLRAIVSAATADEWQSTSDSLDRIDVAEALRTLHATLSESGDEFGHRTFYEALRMTAALHLVGVEGSLAALDHIVLLKILPRIHGSRRRAEPVLRHLRAFAQTPLASRLVRSKSETDSNNTPELPLSANKLDRMLRSVELNQFVSFTD